MDAQGRQLWNDMPCSAHTFLHSTAATVGLILSVESPDHAQPDAFLTMYHTLLPLTGTLHRKCRSICHCLLEHSHSKHRPQTLLAMWRTQQATASTQRPGAQQRSQLHTLSSQVDACLRQDCPQLMPKAHHLNGVKHCPIMRLSWLISCSLHM